MKFVADLHLHSKYSRACSQSLTLENLAHWGKLKGIGVLATSDWTHPAWLDEIKAKLEQAENGLYKLRKSNSEDRGQHPVYFLLSTEISSIYSQGGKQRRIHNLVFVPSLATAENIIKKLKSSGANLSSDGRPIIGLSAAQLVELVLATDEKSLIVPSHIWTPWYSLYGSNSGFDSIEECFGEFAKNIYAIETGLSSDPAMNWRIAELDNRAILSFSDAHSLPKLGREATIFDAELSYEGIYEAVTGEGSAKVAFTVEFFPEEGKYHYTGHRNCNVKHSPEETAKSGTICGVCGKNLTVGVMQRVENLASRSFDDLKIVEDELVNSLTFAHRPPFKKLIPLTEVIAESLEVGENSQAVLDNLNNLVKIAGSELAVLLTFPTDQLAGKTQPKIIEGIERVRRGEVLVDPGYDGVYGKVKIWPQQQTSLKPSQIELF